VKRSIKPIIQRRAKKGKKLRITEKPLGRTTKKPLSEKNEKMSFTVIEITQFIVINIKKE
jgi:hypothetical protein